MANTIIYQSHKKIIVTSEKDGLITITNLSNGVDNSMLTKRESFEIGKDQIEKIYNLYINKK